MENLIKEDYALLSQFSYIDLPKEFINKLDHADPNKGLNMGTALNELTTNNDLKRELTNDQITLIHQMLTSPEICDLQFVQYENNDSLIGNKAKLIEKQTSRDNKEITGFVGMGFVSPEGNPIAVFRGSEPLQPGNADSDEDWSDNLGNMLLGKESTQYGQAEEFFTKLVSKADGRPIVVGHSKAGNLGGYICSVFGNCDAFLFNPLPLHKNQVNEENIETCNINTYVVEGDFIATLLAIFEPWEIEVLLHNYSAEQLKSMLGNGLDHTVKLLKNEKGETLLKIGSRLVERILRGYVDLGDFKWNFNNGLKGNFYGYYYYLGNVYIQDSDYSIKEMVDAHSTHNFYESYYPTIELSLGSSQTELIEKFQKINKKLGQIDKDLNWLLPRILVDFNPLHTIENIKTGYKVVASDFKIGKSTLIYMCISWLKQVDSQFRNTERANVEKTNRITTPNGIPGAHNIQNNVFFK